MSTGIAPTVSSTSATVESTGATAPGPRDGLRRLRDAIEHAADVALQLEHNAETLNQFLV